MYNEEIGYLLNTKENTGVFSSLDKSSADVTLYAGGCMLLRQLFEDLIKTTIILH